MIGSWTLWIEKPHQYGICFQWSSSSSSSSLHIVIFHDWSELVTTYICKCWFPNLFKSLWRRHQSETEAIKKFGSFQKSGSKFKPNLPKKRNDMLLGNIQFVDLFSQFLPELYIPNASIWIQVLGLDPTRPGPILPGWSHRYVLWSASHSFNWPFGANKISPFSLILCSLLHFLFDQIFFFF